MKYFLNCLAVIVLFVTCTAISKAQSIFTGDGDGFSWSDDSNWFSGSAPASNQDIQIQTAPNDNIFMDFDGNTYLASSVTILNSIAANLAFTPAGGFDTLSIGSGGLSNQSSVGLSLQLPVLTTASGTWSAGTGGVALASTLSLNNFGTTLNSGSISLGSETQITITDSSTFGNISGLGSLATSGVLDLTFASALTTGDSLDLFSTNGLSGTFSSIDFSGAYSGSIAADTITGIGGLDWLYSSSTGTLSVVPEPSSLALAGLAGAFGLMMRRRRR